MNQSQAPFVFYDAENLLHILEESGTVRISPFIFQLPRGMAIKVTITWPL